MSPNWGYADVSFRSIERTGACPEEEVADVKGGAVVIFIHRICRRKGVPEVHVYIWEDCAGWTTGLEVPAGNLPPPEPR